MLHDNRSRRMRGLFTVMTVLFVAGTCKHSSEVRAAFEGDKENLEMVVAKYRENLDRLKTWKGKVLRTNRPLRGKTETLVENRIEFAYDARSGRYRYHITTLRDVSIVEGKEEPRLKPKNVGGLFTKEGFYDLIYITGNEEPRKAVVRAKKKMEPGWHAGTFEAMYFFTDQGGWHDQDVKIIIDNFESPAAVGSVKRNGDTITMLQVVDKDSVEKVFSLAKGGNAIRITTTEKRPDGSERVWVVVWDWENVNGVWVPKSARREARDSPNQGERDNTSLEWEENVVNVPLDEREFALASLGLRQGDIIHDARTNKKMVAQGPQFPPRPSRSKGSGGGWLYLILLNVILVLIIAAGLFVYSRRRKGRA